MLFVVAGCAAETAVSDPPTPTATDIPPTDLPAPVVETAVPTEVAVVEVLETAVLPTDTPEPAPEPELVAVVVESGRTSEGAYYLGSPDAPLTLIDYSDFL